MKTPIEVPLDLILFMVGSICLYFGIREIKKEKKRRKDNFNPFDKWETINPRYGQNLVTYFGFGILFVVITIFHLLEKYLS